MTDTSNQNPNNPINKIEHDQLGRNPMAERLAKIILANYRLQDGYTLAIYGDWGTGKTSVMNLVKENLRALETKKPIIIDFNPWFYGHTQRLDELFLTTLFDEVEKTILSKTAFSWDGILQRFKKWITWAKAFQLLTVLLLICTCFPKQFWIILALLLLIFSLKPASIWLDKGLRMGFSVDRKFNQFIGLVGSTKQLELSIFLSWFQVAQPSAEKIRQNVVEDLRTHFNDTPIVVFLDDLDRLTNEEVLNVFRLVREVANFPNVVYVLGMDKDQVANAISSQLAYKDTDLGMAYMEKIVHHSIELLQFPFLPRILNQLLNEKIPEELHRSYGKRAR
jgi:predicted KAP-like P-loop ATPase